MQEIKLIFYLLFIYLTYNIMNTTFKTSLRGEEATNLCIELLKQEFKSKDFWIDAKDGDFIARKKRELYWETEWKKYNLNIKNIRVNFNS